MTQEQTLLSIFNPWTSFLVPRAKLRDVGWHEKNLAVDL